MLLGWEDLQIAYLKLVFELSVLHKFHVSDYARPRHDLQNFGSWRQKKKKEKVFVLFAVNLMLSLAVLPFCRLLNLDRYSGGRKSSRLNVFGTRLGGIKAEVNRTDRENCTNRGRGAGQKRTWRTAAKLHQFQLAWGNPNQTPALVFLFRPAHELNLWQTKMILFPNEASVIERPNPSICSPCLLMFAHPINFVLYSFWFMTGFQIVEFWISPWQLSNKWSCVNRSASCFLIFCLANWENSFLTGPWTIGANFSALSFPSSSNFVATDEAYPFCHDGLILSSTDFSLAPYVSYLILRVRRLQSKAVLCYENTPLEISSIFG